MTEVALSNGLDKDKRGNEMIKYDGMEFEKVNKFDCHVLGFDMFMTVIPVSPKEHRDKEEARGRTMSAKVIITEDDEFTHFDITDDWGKTQRVSLTNDMVKEIETARAAAKRQGLV